MLTRCAACAKPNAAIVRLRNGVPAPSGRVYCSVDCAHEGERVFGKAPDPRLQSKGQYTSERIRARIAMELAG